MTEKSTKSGFSAAERAAMKERAAELKAEQKGAKAEQDVLDKIAEMPPVERRIAEGIHAIVKAEAPQLTPKTWYGMPGWAKDGKILCFYQSGAKFESRYGTFGFQDVAQLDEGVMWPASFAITEWNDEVAERVRELVRKAAG
ncbi:MAG TPA: DUF1801 domain-containing protein [Rhodoglobus sp.]|nr:DUF1801 domain-containing protein [Rhodoglobus sp.]